jgi:hypothetical protein
MRQTLPEVRSLVRVLLNVEGIGTERSALEEAAERVLERLAERIKPLVGAGGFALLLQRALRRTLKEHPWLGAVQIDSATPWRLRGLTEASENQTREEALIAAQAVLTELIGLLARFLGADIAIRVVRQSFPEMKPRGDAEVGIEETIHE